MGKQGNLVYTAGNNANYPGCDAGCPCCEDLWWKEFATLLKNLPTTTAAPQIDQNIINSDQLGSLFDGWADEFADILGQTMGNSVFVPFAEDSSAIAVHEPEKSGPS